MKRVILCAFIGAVVLFCAQRTASAAVEFCPATLTIQAAGQSDTASAAAALYGFELTALGPRTIAPATLAFDTSGGWYAVDVPRATLTQKVRHYTAPWVEFTRNEYASPVMYVRFPSAVTIAHAWVYTAAAQGDAFGWQSKGTVTCDAPEASSPEQEQMSKNRKRTSPYKLDPKDADRLSDAPSPTSPVFTPRASAALENTKCAEPFRDATVQHQDEPHYPPVRVNMAASTDVEVAINPDGTLLDAWVWGPSGIPQFDAEALRAAKASTYTGARGYCRPVPGEYFFRVTFAPN